MADQTIPSLTEATTVFDADLVYVARKGLQGGFSDNHATVATLGRFLRTGQTEEKSSNYVISVAECDKRWFSNKDSTLSIEFSLPPAADGLEVGIVLEENESVVVAPQGTDTLFPTGVSDGVKITASLAGATVYLRGFSEGWCILSEVGTWVTV
jgi:hypothetical protein